MERAHSWANMKMFGKSVRVSDPFLHARIPMYKNSVCLYHYFLFLLFFMLLYFVVDFYNYIGQPEYIWRNNEYMFSLFGTFLAKTSIGTYT